MRVAILEDDRVLAQQLSIILERGGHSCRIFEDSASILAALPRDTFDLLLLDWNLPDMTGLDVLSWVRTKSMDRSVPVIFVTSRIDGADVVEALNAGADDYVTKPVNSEELGARVAALLRRSFPDRSGEETQVGRFRFDTVRRRLTADGEEIPLTNKEFHLALVLLTNLNRAVARAYLMVTIWNSKHDLQTRTLDAHISRVRSKLGLRPDRGYRLLPIYSYGYRLETISDVDLA